MGKKNTRSKENLGRNIRIPARQKISLVTPALEELVKSHPYHTGNFWAQWKAASARQQLFGVGPLSTPENCDITATGSSNEKVCYGLEERETLLRDRLAVRGLKTIPNDGGGDCVYRSLRQGLGLVVGDQYAEHNHASLRSEVADEISSPACRWRYQPIFEPHNMVYGEGIEEEDFKFVGSYEEYLKEQRQTGCWGGNLERLAVANLYRCRIDVYSIDGDYSIWPDKKEYYHVSHVLWKDHAEATEPVEKCGGWAEREEKARWKRDYSDDDWRTCDGFS